jgi:hypothetical protein
VTKHDQFRRWVGEQNPKALFADGYEDAIIGVAMRCGSPTLVVYDAEKCVETLMVRDGMSFEDASEFFEFNTLGAWGGEGTPLFMYRTEIIDVEDA